VKVFDTLEVMRGLGVAPSTASVLTNLLNGKTDPERARSLEHWALADLEAPPQPYKVIMACCDILGADEVNALQDPDTLDIKRAWVVRKNPEDPTIVWEGTVNEFSIVPTGKDVES
jgi:hypothetical protein